MADFDVNISDGTSVEVVVTPSSGAGAGVTDHGALTGLSDDDHTQYHTDARGDARYSQLGHTHLAAAIDDFVSAVASAIPSSVATDAEVASAISTAINNLINSAPGTLDTLGEIAAALEGDEAAIAALTTAVNARLTQAQADALYSVLGHTHAYADITGKPSTFAPSAHATTHTNGTDDIQNATASQKGLATAAQITKLDTIETGATADQSATEVAFTAAGGIVATNVQAALAELDSEAEKTANKDQNSGYAGLNSSGRVPIARLASGAPDGTKFVRDDGVLATPAGGSSYRTLVTLGSDAATSSTTAADVTGLSFSVTSGTVYRFYALIIYTTSVATNGSAWGVNGPASPTLLAWNARYPDTNTTILRINQLDTYSVGTVSTASPTTTMIAEVTGIIKPSASGALQIRFRSELGTETVTAKAGSTLEWW